MTVVPITGDVLLAMKSEISVSVSAKDVPVPVTMAILSPTVYSIAALGSSTRRFLVGSALIMSFTTIRLLYPMSALRNAPAIILATSPQLVAPVISASTVSIFVLNSLIYGSITSNPSNPETSSRFSLGTQRQLYESVTVAVVDA